MGRAALMEREILMLREALMGRTISMGRVGESKNRVAGITSCL